MSRRRNRLLLVYHKPGNPQEHQRIEEFTARLRNYGLDIAKATIEDALATQYQCDQAFLTLFTRGGHWLSLVQKGYRVEHIPPHLSAAAIARETRRLGLTRVVLVALRAHRLREEQLEDLQKIQHILEKTYSVETEILVLENLTKPPAFVKNNTIIAPLALLDGKLVHRACSIKGSNTYCLGPFMDYGEEILAAWIIDRAANTEAVMEQAEMSI